MLWQKILAWLEAHQDRFGLIDGFYLFTSLCTDAALAATQLVTTLLALPAGQVARFRDQPKPSYRTGWNATAPLPRDSAAAPAIPPTALAFAAETGKMGR